MNDPYHYSLSVDQGLLVAKLLEHVNDHPHGPFSSKAVIEDAKKAFGWSPTYAESVWRELGHLEEELRAIQDAYETCAKAIHEELAEVGTEADGGIYTIGLQIEQLVDIGTPAALEGIRNLAELMKSFGYYADPESYFSFPRFHPQNWPARSECDYFFLKDEQWNPDHWLERVLNEEPLPGREKPLANQ